MRIHRISLRDFRGVEPLDAEFDPSGVTIVEGRNEIGKTSIADAFMLLLDHKDSSSKRTVRDVQPIGRDVGPFAEAELTVGSYRFVYRKRWLRDKKTELDIAEPQREQLTGEAAHNRMVEILESETDHALFRALRYQQGVAISQAAIARAPSLAAALDAAAGGTPAVGGAGQDVLLGLVEQERQRYFTGKGAMPLARKNKAEQLDELRGEVAAVEGRIRKLEDAAERQHRIEGELVDLRQQAPAVAEQIDESLKKVEVIEEVERRVERAQHEREQAESALREAIAARDARKGLIEAAGSAAKTLAALEEDIASAAPGLASAQSAVTEAEKAHAAAGAAVESAEREAAGHKLLVELFDLRLQRDQLRERHKGVVAADETIETAELFLAGCAVDDKLLRKIDVAADKLAVAKGRAEAGKPRLAIEVLRPVNVTVNGEARDAVPGAPIEEVVSAEVEAIIGDVARIVVSPPEAAGDAENALARVQQRLDDLLSEAGVASPSEARGMVRERSQHETERGNATQRREEALRDLEPAQLAAKLARAQERVDMLEAEHDPSAASAESFEDARTLAHQAETQLRDARSLEAERQTSLTAAQGALRVLEDRGIEQRTRLEGAEEEASRSAGELEEHRAAISDEDVDKTVEGAGARVTAAAGEHETAEQELAAGDPKTARAMLENAQELQKRLVADLKAREIESAETRTQLELGGHEGLSDRLADTQAKLEDLQRDVNAENRRAAAVARLQAILSEKREQAQQTYVGPFCEKVNAYARILYGPEVEVAIDHLNFELASRTLNGTTVPFGSLSGGVREQLAVLARLACGALVSPPAHDGTPGGVPVIIDDALGYSDPDRLEKLGAAIGVAGKDCQVIVLTCEPGRYRRVGGAKVISLG
ncbi:MAG: AAA family ATPase [Solirubrobacteraceae bacterium]